MRRPYLAPPAGAWRLTAARSRGPPFRVRAAAAARGRRPATATPHRHPGADRTGDAAADIFGPIHPIGRFRESFGSRQLVEFLVVAALQIDDVAVAGARNHHHGKTVRGGVRERDEPIEKARA